MNDPDTSPAADATPTIPADMGPSTEPPIVPAELAISEALGEPASPQGFLLEPVTIIPLSDTGLQGFLLEPVTNIAKALDAAEGSILPLGTEQGTDDRKQ